jgi:hypothetical protein
MERREFLLGLLGGLAAATCLVSAGTTSAEAASPELTRAEGPEAAELTPDTLDGLATEHTQYYRRRGRRVYRRYYRRPARRYYRRARRYYRRY